MNGSRTTIYFNLFGYNLGIWTSIQFGILLPLVGNKNIRPKKVMNSFKESFNFVNKKIKDLDKSSFKNDNTSVELNGLKENLKGIQEAIDEMPKCKLKAEFQVIFDKYKFQVYQLVMILEGRTA